MNEEKSFPYARMTENKQRCRNRKCNADMSGETDARMRYCTKCREHKKFMASLNAARQITDED